MQNFSTVFQNVAATVGITVILLRISGRFYQLIMPLASHLCKEIIACAFQFRPQFGFAATIPSAGISFIFQRIFALIIRLQIIEQRRRGESQHLTLQRHSTRQSPVACFRLCFRTGVSPRQCFVGDCCIQQFQHEVHGRFHTAPGQVVTAFGADKRLADNRQTAIPTESDKISISQ